MASRWLLDGLLASADKLTSLTVRDPHPPIHAIINLEWGPHPAFGISISGPCGTHGYSQTLVIAWLDGPAALLETKLLSRRY